MKGPRALEGLCCPIKFRHLISQVYQPQMYSQPPNGTLESPISSTIELTSKI